MPEIVLYQPVGSTNGDQSHIEVILDEDTVWLTQSQMVSLFKATKQNISLHISNIYKEGELLPGSTVKEYLTVRQEGSRKINRKILIYNLDVIISVGYRIKSKIGTQFRIWATQIVRDYLLKGHAIHQRINRVEKKLQEHDQKFDLIINANLPPMEGIFFDGQVFDAWQFVAGLIRKANTAIVIVDNYVDETILTLLSKRKPKVAVRIYTQKQEGSFNLDLKKYQAQYQDSTVHIFKKSHDRFLIIDNSVVYHFGASLKDLGKKWFAFSKMMVDAKEILQRLKK